MRFLTALALLLPTPTLAHFGGIDSIGCHNDRQAGDYHCHEGPLANQEFASEEAGRAAFAAQGGVLDDTDHVTPAIGDGPIVGQTSVIDADTIEIRGQRIRLFGVDAPEGDQPCQDAAGQTYRCGQRAALALADHIGRRTVSCDRRDIDQYDRVVSVCSAAGEDLNAWLVNSGHAVAYREYSDDYVPQEAAAKLARRGIWAGAFIEPAKYRRGN